MTNNKRALFISELINTIYGKPNNSKNQTEINNKFNTIHNRNLRFFCIFAITRDRNVFGPIAQLVRATDS